MSRTGSITWSLISVSSLEAFERSDYLRNLILNELNKKYAKR